jgi:peptide deformylase
MLEVCIFGNPVLRRKAGVVLAFDEGLRRFAAGLVETMYAKDGVGLAAPQVGESLRVVAIDATGGDEPALVLVNPEITSFSEEVGDYEEGCLSVPDIRLDVRRPIRVSARAWDVNGREHRLENVEGLLARVLQHEIDHLDGILFVDRVSTEQRQLVDAKLKKLAKAARESICSV